MLTVYSFKPKSFLLLCALVSSNLIIAQSLPRTAIQVKGGYSRHGSGDYNGIVFGGSYLNYLSKRFSLDYNLLGTINDGKDEIIVTDNNNGTRTDASVRFTNAGVQLGINGRYSMIRSAHHELLVALGAFGRYQSDSNGSDGYRLYSPQLTGQPTILIGYDNRTPQETFAAGGLLHFQYNYTFRNHVYIGVSPAFQTDTNGDAIPHVSLAFGKRF